MTKKYVTELRHCASVSVWILQDAETKELAGKIISNFSDGGVCTTGIWIYGGKLATDGSLQRSCGGSGYDKLNSNLCALMRSKFDSYKEVADLDAGLIESWFLKHDYLATAVL